MVNEKGAPKKYPDKKWNHTSFYRPDGFQTIWEMFDRLAHTDTDPAFETYCRQVEHVDLDKKGRGRTGSYLRWVIAQHVRTNAHKLKGGKQ